MKNKLKIFIINLKRSEDRKAAMQEQIARFFAYQPELRERLEFIFFEGVDAKNGEHLEFREHFPTYLSHCGLLLSEGEKGCFASHFKLWQKCVKLDESIVVLEDDVSFSSEFLRGGGYIEQILCCPYEFVRFLGLADVKSYTLKENFLLTFDGVGGTQGYFLRPSAALKFIKAHQIWIRAVDDIMDMSYQNRVLNVIFSPFLLEYKNGESLIVFRGVKKKRVYAKVIKEILRLYFQFKKIIFSFYMRKRLRLKKARKLSEMVSNFR